jgi:aerotaxis receptor
VAAWADLRRSVVTPLAAATEAVNALAGGDLGHECAGGGHDDMGRLLGALRQLNLNLKAIVGDVRMNVRSIEGAVRAIAVGNADLARRTEAQAANLVQTAASLGQVAVSAGEATDSALRADQVVTAAAGVAGRGGQAVERVGATMDRISDSATRIVDIIALIDGIAFQTNLLALNAAVEAARAGEQGRGFAVVAGEVRALAQRTATAAGEIKMLIDQSAQQVEQGATLVGDAGGTMREVVASVRGAAAIMNDISRASREQHHGIAQVNQAMTQLDGITRQNAALVEESAAASASVAMEASRLVQALSVFRLAALVG